MATLYTFSANAMVGDTDEQLVSGDAAATFVVHLGRLALRFDTTDEMAALTQPVEMPTQYTGSGLTATIHLASESANSGNFRFDVFVEAVTPNSDTLDMEAASSWDSANSVSHALGGTAGDPRSSDVTLTNADSVAAGDLVRFGIRRDTDHADDAAAGDAFVYSLTIEDDG